MRTVLTVAAMVACFLAGLTVGEQRAAAQTSGIAPIPSASTLRAAPPRDDVPLLRQSRRARPRASRSEARKPLPKRIVSMPPFPAPWQALAECESLGDLSWKPTAPSTFRGFFQFLPSTWRSVGGTGDPALASAAEQLHRAQLLQARDGWGPWPVCSRKVGLR